MGKRYRNHIFGVYLKKDPKYLTVTLLASQNKVLAVSMCTDTNQSNYSGEGWFSSLQTALRPQSLKLETERLTVK